MGTVHGGESVSNCEILYDEEEPASPELICILDYMEQEFLLYDLSFVLNIPKGMCINLITTPSWHYDRPTGYGPQTIVHTKIAGTNDTERDQYCVQGTSNCTDDAGSIPELCNRYVYTRGEEKFSCCLGSYTIIGESRETESWGGEAKNCLGGAGRTSWDAYDNDGFPIHLAEYVLENGLRRTFNISNLIEVALGGIHSTPIANYMKMFDKPPEDFRNDSVTFPEFFSLDDFYRPSLLGRSGNPFFIFSCLDSAGEILHRINLMIREWNTAEEFETHYESGGSDESADPDVEGIEGDDCPYEKRSLFTAHSLFSECNDYLDLDDIIDSPLDYPFANYQQ